MKKREVRVINAPVWVLCVPLGSIEGCAVAFSIGSGLSSPVNSLNPNAVIVPQSEAREKSFLKEIPWGEMARQNNRKKRPRLSRGLFGVVTAVGGNPV